MNATKLISEIREITEYRELSNLSEARIKINNLLYRFKFTTSHSLLEDNNLDSLFTYWDKVKPCAIKNLWVDTFNSPDNTYSSGSYHYRKMSIAKYIAKDIYTLDKNLKYKFVGRRSIKVSEFNKVIKDLSWEKAEDDNFDVVILGDNPDFATVNFDILSGNISIVMEDALKDYYHFNLSNLATWDSINNDKIAESLSNVTYSSLNLVINSIKYLKKDILSEENKYLLVRAFCHVFLNGSISFSLKDKEHVNLSNSIKHYLLPYHKYLVSAHSLNALSGCSLNFSRSIDLNFGLILSYPTRKKSFSYSGRGKRWVWNTVFTYIHDFDDRYEIIKKDSERSQIFSLFKSHQHPISLIRTRLSESIYSYTLKFNKTRLVIYDTLGNREISLTESNSSGYLNDLLVQHPEFEKVKEELFIEINSLLNQLEDGDFSYQGILTSQYTGTRLELAKRLAKLSSKINLDVKYLKSNSVNSELKELSYLEAESFDSNYALLS